MIDQLVTASGIITFMTLPMVEVQVNVLASDDFDANPTVKLVSITSNEPDNGLGDGDTTKDIDIRPDGRIFLRAERSGSGTGRVYTLTYSATDSAGNITYSTTRGARPLKSRKVAAVCYWSRLKNIILLSV